MNGQDMIGDFTDPQEKPGERPVKTNPCPVSGVIGVSCGGVGLQTRPEPPVTFLDEHNLSPILDPEQVVHRRVIGGMAVIDRERITWPDGRFPQHFFPGRPDDLESQVFQRRTAGNGLPREEQEGEQTANDRIHDDL